MQQRTNSQNRELHVLLTKKWQLEGKNGKEKGDLRKSEKTALVKRFTDGRSESSKKMTLIECETLIKYLRAEINNIQKSMDTMRKKIIALSHEMDWEHENGKPDMNRINGWCLKYGKFKKQLNDHSSNELVNLVSQFEKVHEDYIKNLHKRP